MTPTLPPTSRILPAAAALLCLSAYSPPAGACGGVAHQTIGQLMLNELKEAELKTLLQGQQNAFRNGVFHPDIMYKVLPSDEAEAGHLDQGATSNYLIDYIKYLQTHCNGQPGDCADRYAFLFGILTHVVSDANFDLNFVGKYSNDGVLGVTRECGFNARPAEQFTDTDLDLCLSKNIAGMATTLADQLPATRLDTGAICGPSQFIDPSNWHCWSCASGYNRTVFPVNGSQACQLNHTVYKKATRTRKNSYVGQGCPGGQFWDIYGGDFGLGACYSCDGYNRTLEPVWSDRACSDVPYGTATDNGKPGCGAGAFWDVGLNSCWKCPEGYNRTLLYPVDGPRACEKTGALCAQMTDYPRLQGLPLPVGIGSIPIEPLVAAYKSSGITMNAVELGAAIQAVSTGALVYYGSEPAATNDFFTAVSNPATPYAKQIFRCGWGLTNFVKSSGGLQDSAKNAAAFMDNMWRTIQFMYRQGSGDLKIVRTGVTLYQVSFPGAVTFTNLPPGRARRAR